MKHSNTSSNHIEKLMEVLAHQNKRGDFRRKMSASNDKRAETTDPSNLLIDNMKERPLKANEGYQTEEDQKEVQLHQRSESRDNKNNLKLPNINIKKSVIEKENELMRAETGLYRIEGKRLNLQAFSDVKSKTVESLDELPYKFMNIKPIKYEKSPHKNPDYSIKSLKNVRQKHSIKQDSLKECLFEGEGNQVSKVNYEKIEERRLKSVNKRVKDLTRKELSVAKKQNYDQNNRKQRKQTKSNSISQTVNVVNKRRYSNNYLDFCFFVSLLNKYNFLPTSVSNYKAFVGKGNNSILIKNTLKNRFWWNISDNDNQCNLYWLQNRDNKFLQNLKSSGTQQIEEKECSTKHKFILDKSKDTRESEKSMDVIRQYTNYGFWKLMSVQEKASYIKNEYTVEIEVGKQYQVSECANKLRVHNHFQFNWNITNKKALYYNLKKYYMAMKVDPFQYIPLTFHIQTEGDSEWQRFQQYFCERQSQISQKEGKIKKRKQKNLWIIKPGQNSNQGCGIQVAQTLQQIKQIIKSKESSGTKKRSHIIQRYLMPLLYQKRKFDIRCYILVTSINKIVKAYWYEEGYIRTSSKEFTLKNLKNRFVHLTNDAVQKKSDDYGKYENGNKVSFTDFQKYLQATYADKEFNFFTMVYPKMMKLAADSIRSVGSLLDACNREHSFEIFGLDFMIDEQFNTWLIEVNNNPCLELGCPLLARIIPNMIQNAFRIAIDPMFPPPKDYPKSKNMPSELFESNKFTLIFHSQDQKEKLKDYLNQIDPKNLSNIVESDEEQENHED